MATIRDRNSRKATRPERPPIKTRASFWRALWVVFAIAGMALISPWRSVDNAAEVAEVQTLVDEMSTALESIAAGTSSVDDFTLANDGFEGFSAVTPGGIPAEGFIGPSEDNCLVLHWTNPDIAQVGRLSAGRTCDASEIDEVPLRPNDGYVPGTGPPFDVTPLIREAHTPAWFIAVLVALVWLAIRAGLDLFLIFQRPDYFFADK